ncbi:MAG: hypothetical protein HY909_26570 [Deltaproteobacteria bacterium]|nr:hypothetical protein [Deltaproteobacteria bacterium]
MTSTFIHTDLRARLKSFRAGSFDELERFLRLQPDAPRDGRFVALKRAVDAFQGFARESAPGFDFYTDLLPQLREWALDSGTHRPLPLLRSGEPGRVELSERQVRHILACAFFLGTISAPSAGTLSLLGVYLAPWQEAVERVLCLLAYFHRSHDAREVPSVVFSRYRQSPSSRPSWAELDLPVRADSARLHTQDMESSPAPVFVDFANRDLHIHRIIPSLTQEEVLFSCCPELFPGILFCERLLDDEVIVVEGARRFTTYRGYLSTFRFTGLHPARPAQEVLVVDAVMSGQFAPSRVLRDLNKFHLGLASCRGRQVSTGHWGCGAFGGDKTLKFLQQVCAATAAGGLLDYSTFRDEDTCARLGALLSQAEARGHTVASLVRLACAYEGLRDRPPFARYVTEGLGG